jgi:DNA-directed RNA polymerase specialized sigma24 family protein
MNTIPSPKPTDQKELLRKAQEFAELGDGLSMLKFLFESMILEALLWRFRRQYSNLNTNDIYDIIASSADELYNSIMRGTKIKYLETYLWKIANNKLAKFSKKAMLTLSVDDDSREIKDPGRIPEVYKNSREEAKKKAIQIAESLLPQLRLTKVEAVMRYILEALKNGAQDVPNLEIANSLGISVVNVRIWKSRGFERLARIVKEGNLIEDSYEFPFLDELESFLADCHESDSD